MTERKVKVHILHRRPEFGTGVKFITIYPSVDSFLLTTEIDQKLKDLFYAAWRKEHPTWTFLRLDIVEVTE